MDDYIEEQFEIWFQAIMELIADDFEQEVMYDSKEEIYNNFVRVYNSRSIR